MIIGLQLLQEGGDMNALDPVPALDVFRHPVSRKIPNLRRRCQQHPGTQRLKAVASSGTVEIPDQSVQGLRVSIGQRVTGYRIEVVEDLCSPVVHRSYHETEKLLQVRNDP
jgi:hypothetical protein